MCTTIWNLATDEEYTTPRQLRALVGPAHCPPCKLPVYEDECLCDVDVKACLEAADIAYEFDGVEYMVSRPALK